MSFRSVRLPTRSQSSLLHRFLWEGPGEQNSTACDNYVLTAIKLIGDWEVPHMPDGGMPERATVVGPQCYTTADGPASEVSPRTCRKTSRRCPFTSKVMVPANFSGLVID